MIKYKKRIIENQSHGRNTTHLVKSMNGIVKPPSIITCFGSFRLNIRPPIERDYQVGDEMVAVKSYFKYSRNDGPIKTVVIDIQAVFDDPSNDRSNNDVWKPIDLQLAELEKDLCRGTDGISLAFYLNSNLCVERTDFIPNIDSPAYDVRNRMIDDSNNVKYTLSGISGNGEFPMSDMYIKQIRDISIPLPLSMILDLPQDDVNADHPRWYPGNTLTDENNKLTIYPSGHTDDVAFDLFEAMGGVGVEPLVITSCVAASPRLYQCMNTVAGGANMRGGNVRQLNSFNDSLDMSTMRFEEVRSRNNEYYAPYPLTSSPSVRSVETIWPPVNINGEMLHRNFVCKYSKNNGDVKTIRWSTQPQNDGQHTVWNAIKELILDETGRTAFGLLDFNIRNDDYKYGNNLVKTGISSNANMLLTSRYGNQINTTPLSQDFSAVVIRDGVITFTTDYEGFSWNENTLTIYPTVQTEMSRNTPTVDYYNLLCETHEQITEGLPIVIHSCGVVEPINHAQIDTKFNLDSDFMTRLADSSAKLSYNIKLNNGEVKQILQKQPDMKSLAETLSEVMRYVMFMGNPMVRYNAYVPDTVVPERYVNKLYFKQHYNDMVPSLAGCSGIERGYDKPQFLVEFSTDGNPTNAAVQVLSDLNSAVPVVTESNSVTFVKTNVPGYVDFFDMIQDTVGDEHTIYSTAIVPSVIFTAVDDGGVPPVDPPVEPPVDNKSTDFIFSINSMDHEQSQVHVNVVLNGITDGWELYNDLDELMATNLNPEGFTANGNKTNLTLKFRNEPSTRATWRLRVTCSLINISQDLFDDTGIVQKEINVLQFGKTVKQYSFHVKQATLTVPSALPTHVTTTSNMFLNCYHFNQDISTWDVSNVYQMDNMFNGATRFNQNLSIWCVSNISKTPHSFDKNATAWTLPRPQWGTCPTESITPPPDGDVTPFVFRTFNNRSETEELPVELSLTATTEPWSLTSIDDDIVVHNSETMPLSPGERITINFGRLGSNARNYKLEGVVEDVDVVIANKYQSNGTLEVESFSDIISRYKYNVKDANITVPTLLPAHITNTDGMFEGCYNFNQDITTWDTTNVTSMVNMFKGCTVFNQDISQWNVSNVTNIAGMFYGCNAFNQDLFGWDVSKVTSLRETFYDCSVFDSNINSWSVTNVTDLTRTFQNCRVFNQPLSNWSTPNLLAIDGCFSGASRFNQSINNFDVHQVTTLTHVFDGATAFNQPLDNWNVSAVSKMNAMFSSASNFNQDLSKWCVSLIGYKPQNGFDLNDNPNWTLPKPIWGTCPSDVPIVTGDTMVFTIDPDDTIPINSRFYITLGNAGDNWLLSDATGVVASPTDRESDFILSDSYPTKQLIISNLVVRAGEYTLTTTSDRIDLQFGNGGVGIADPVNMRVNVSKFSDTVTSYGFVLPTTLLTVPTVLPRSVTNCEEMFQHCKYFNQDISMWDMSNVTNMTRMFNHTHLFNQSLNTWDVSNVVTMEDMFLHAYGFNGAIGDWNTSKVTNMHSMFNAARAFNQDIGNWNVSNVTNMEGMFFDTPKFNQNLSDWCVTNIPVIPSSFTYYENIWTLPKPVWGTCPIVENPEILDPTVFNAEVKLNTISYQHKTDIVLDISIDSSDWEVYFNNDLVASSTVGSADGQPVQKVGNKVTINPNFLNALITVKGTMNNLGFKVVTYPQVDPVVNISHFSNTISSYAINTGFAPLSVPTILPSVVNSMAMMFNGTRNVVSDITNWDTTNINDMQYLFSDCAAFNQDIGSWNTSAVTNMEGLFREAWLFNGNIGQWDTSNVVNMTYMFTNSHAFNQDLSGWNVAKISNKPEGFGDEWLSDWVLPKPIWGTVGTPIVEDTLPPGKPMVLNIDNLGTVPGSAELLITMYLDNPSSTPWAIKNSDNVIILDKDKLTTDNMSVTITDKTIAIKYRDAVSVKSDMSIYGKFNSVSITTVDEYTWHANTVVTITDFGELIDQYYIKLRAMPVHLPSVLPSNVTNLSDMFTGSFEIFGDINAWNVTNVTNMSKTFANCKFNLNIADWDVSNVTTMESMFNKNKVFNKDISNWDVSNVSNMNNMFNTATLMSYDLTDWSVVKIPSKPIGFSDGADNLPVGKHPVWGTNGVPIVPPVEPVDPVLPSEGTYKFSTVNTREPTKDLPFIFSITSTNGDWSLLKNDVVIASVDVTDTPGVTVESFLAGNYDITIESDFDVEANYEFKGTTDGIKLMLFDDHYLAPNDDVGSVTVASFASDVMYHTFSLHGVNLTVPDVLPQHMTDLSNMFARSSAFNQDLSMWDVSLVDNMTSMFEECSTYNQDLSSWNTPLIPIEPEFFAINADAWVLPKPNWGGDVP